MASHNKTALVTGAGTGVGRAVALAGRRKEMLDVNVLTMTIMATKMPFVGHG